MVEPGTTPAGAGLAIPQQPPALAHFEIGQPVVEKADFGYLRIPGRAVGFEVSRKYAHIAPAHRLARQFRRIDAVHLQADEPRSVPVIDQGRGLDTIDPGLVRLPAAGSPKERYAGIVSSV